MTDAHCHTVRDDATRRFICEPGDVASARPGDIVFFGLHPWNVREGTDAAALRDGLVRRLAEAPAAGVGETGLDRLRDKNIPQAMRAAFRAQLEAAAAMRRPVVLHGAKCWGETLAACRPFAKSIPAFLFHSFSRSWGLVDDIRRLGGFVSVGPAVLNVHAANYREAVARLPDDMILVESDATPGNAGEVPRIGEIAGELARLRGVSAEELERRLECNADRFAEWKG